MALLGCSRGRYRLKAILLALAATGALMIASYGSTNLVDHQHPIEIRNDELDQTIAPETSQQRDLIDMQKREEIQRRRIDSYCTHYSMDNLTFTLPMDKHERYLLKRHLLFDDEAQVLFCWVEKIGCTELKRMFAVHKGLMPTESISWTWWDEPMARQYLFPLYASYTLANTNLTDESRIHRMKKYHKMMIVRNPLERLVSGYLNKIRQHQQPAQGEFPFPLDVKREMIARYHPTKYQLWLDSNYSEPVISFPEFVQYIVDTEQTFLNSHFKPMIDVCHPCRVRYDFYGNFKTLHIDGYLLADKLGAKREYFRNKPTHSHQDRTATKLKHYYSQLHYELKKRLLMHWWSELDFYYHVYPEERHSHKELLDIDTDLYSGDL